MLRCVIDRSRLGTSPPHPGTIRTDGFPTRLPVGPASPASWRLVLNTPIALTAAPAGRVPDAEKLTINLGFVDLGQIDLLVREGFYANRTDFIRTAIRVQLAGHGDVLKQTVARKQFVLGVQHYRRADLEALRDAGQRLTVHVLGLATIADDVPPELARDTIERIVVLGAWHASAAVKAALADRTG